jgi:hypothetical protein
MFGLWLWGVVGCVAALGVLAYAWWKGTVNERPMVGYDTDGDGTATFERSCPKCGRVVRADKAVTMDGRGRPVGENATCKLCGRHGVGIELNPTYADMARRRVADDAPLFNAGAS